MQKKHNFKQLTNDVVIFHMQKMPQQTLEGIKLGLKNPNPKAIMATFEVMMELFNNFAG